MYEDHADLGLIFFSENIDLANSTAKLWALETPESGPRRPWLQKFKQIKIWNVAYVAVREFCWICVN